MDFRLKIAGMGVAALILGVVYGKSIESTPRYFGKDEYARYARSDSDTEEPDRAEWGLDLPNRYAMVTPNGRIEADELSYYVRNREDWAAYGRYREPLFLPEPEWQWDETNSASSFDEADRLAWAPRPAFRDAVQQGHMGQTARLSDRSASENSASSRASSRSRSLANDGSPQGKIHLAPVLESDSSE